jgi:hypothetical protein
MTFNGEYIEIKVEYNLKDLFSRNHQDYLELLLMYCLIEKEFNLSLHKLVVDVEVSNDNILTI